MFEEVKKEQLDVTISPLQEKDIADLDLILRENVRDRNSGEILEDEIEEIKGYMRGGEEIINQETGESRRRDYLVSKDKNGKALGCMAYSKPDPQMLAHFEKVLRMDKKQIETKCVELLNAFVSRDVFRGRGVGRKLFEAIVVIAKNKEKEYIGINSGPRYENSWEFYDKIGAERCGVIAEKYGKGGDAMTWMKKI
jgi:ribosomal protein S18 acetylase RimI-like enzyme